MDQRSRDLGGKLAIVLTATVKPNVARTALTDPIQRLRQYQATVETWSRVAIERQAKLTIVETSGWRPDDLVELLPEHHRILVDVVPYEPSSSEIARGKGTIEAAAFTKVLENLDADFQTVFKATGRLTVANAATLLRAVPANSIAARGTLDRKWLDTRFFAIDRALWLRELRDVAHWVDDDGGVYLEHVLAGRIAWLSSVHRAHRLRFSERPEVKGVSGTNGEFYRATPLILLGVRSHAEALLWALASRKSV